MIFWPKIRVFIFFIFIGTIVGGLFAYSLWGEVIPLEEIRAYIQRSTLAPLLFVLFYIAITVFIPTTPMMALSGIFFGFWHGIVYTTIAGIIGAMGTFLLARVLGKNFVDTVLEHKKSLQLIEKYDERIARHGVITTIILRITPIMPFNVLNLLMGISRVKFKDYVIGTLLGLIPSSIITVYFGTLFLTETFRQISFYLAIVSLLIIGVWFYNKKMRRKL